MAFTVDDIFAVEAQTAASKYADDTGLDLDSTTCMTNGTVGEDCDEFKEGTINCKVIIDIDPASILTMSARWYLNSVMQAGDNACLPYTDSNSVDNTNENVQAYDSAGQWIEHNSLGSAFIAQLGDIGGGQCAIRLAATNTGSGNAKSKIGEVNLDITIYTFTLAGVTRDNDESALVSCEYRIYKRTGLAPETWSESVVGTSNGSTGVFTEEVGRATYRIVAIKDVTPQVMDIGPPMTASQAAASDDVFTLGTFSGLANDDEVEIYQAGASALPTGVSEGVNYFVVQTSGDTCKLSLTQGGSAINITVDGDAWIVGKPETS